MWLGNLEHEKFPSFTSSSPRLRECGFRNPINFCWWNPESGKLLADSAILGFGIRNPSKDLNPESKFHWQRLESSTWNPEFTACYPESKTVLDSLTWGDRARSRFTENKKVLSQFSKNKIGISLFTEKRENVFLQSKALFVVFTIRPLRVLRNAKRKPSSAYQNWHYLFLKISRSLWAVAENGKRDCSLWINIFLLPSVEKKKTY